eukprot:TRINITY_DN26764_c0_g1_i2.p1 TRINITY_DN26764_c0_g1~~TRINITY_DN26764_c0_g1_i2.p1  ORF type:complete len:679 (+),score=141.29 TRINITY_DN26764_c0_g1_i2:52-2037(+)
MHSARSYLSPSPTRTDASVLRALSPNPRAPPPHAPKRPRSNDGDSRPVGNAGGRSAGDAVRVVQHVAAPREVRCIEAVGHDVWLGCRDGCVDVRCARTGADLAMLGGQSAGVVWCIRLVGPSQGGSVWVGMSTGTIAVYDPETRVLQRQLRRHAGGVRTIVDAEGHVWTGGADFVIFEWDRDCSFVRQYSGHRGGVRCLLKVGPTLVSGAEDCTLRLWDTTSGKHLHTLRFHDGPVHALAGIGDDVWSAGVDGLVVWRIDTLSVVERPSGHDGAVMTLARVGSRMYSGGQDQMVCAWDGHTRQLLGRLQDHCGWVTAARATALVTRYYVWSAAAHDAHLMVWSHDEYRALDSGMKRHLEAGADMAAAGGGRAADTIAGLRDTVAELQRKCRELQGQVAGHRERETLLEDELGEQHRALAEQLGLRRATTQALRSAETERLPTLEAALAARERELSRRDTEVQNKNTAIQDLRQQLAGRDATVTQLQRQLAVAEAERNDYRRAHDSHKQAHLRYIECDVDAVLEEARRREERLQAECERLRRQLVQALDLNTVLRGREVAASAVPAQDLAGEAAKALALGLPGGPSPARPAPPPWRDPALGDYIRARYYSPRGSDGAARVPAPPPPARRAEGRSYRSPPRPQRPGASVGPGQRPQSAPHRRY